MKLPLVAVLVGLALAGGLLIGLRSGSGGRSTKAAPVQALSPQACSSVLYAGAGRPRYLLAVAIDLATGGYGREAQLPDVVSRVFREHRFRAGGRAVAYQLCDVGSAQTGLNSPDRCRIDASQFAADPSVIGVVTLSDSACSQSLIRPLNQATPGPLALVAAVSTYVGLTHSGPGTAAGEPQSYYPAGGRNFARVIAADDVQGAAEGLFASRLGVRRAFVLDDGSAYAIGVAASFRRAATRLGVTIVGSGRVDYPPTRERALVRRVVASRADAVYLGVGGSADNAQLVRRLHAALGARARLIAPDSYFAAVVPRVIGPAADGTVVSAPGVPIAQLPSSGRQLAARLGPAAPQTLQSYAVYAAEATEVMLDAVARSDGTRQSVTKRLLQTKLQNGPLGGVSFDANGDVSSTAVSMYEIRGGAFSFLKVVRPPVGLVG
jgi:branched-chain amino acid transport system substrate-binding protein